MQIRNDRRLSPWDLKRDSSVLIPIALENSPDVLSGEIWQGVTEPAAGERGDREKRPQVLAIKINLAKEVNEEKSLSEGASQDSSGVLVRGARGEEKRVRSPHAKVKVTRIPEDGGRATEPD